jgi:predicted NBD/HSP70 family sugar kinase
MLPGTSETRYMRLPLPVLLVAAPLMGAAFAMFLPFIGIAMVLDFVAKKAWGVAREAAHGAMVAMGPRTRTGEAYFTGTADEKKPGAADKKADEALSKIEQKIDEHDEQARK